MRIIAFAFLLAITAGSLNAQTNSMDSVSYSLGVLMAQNLKSQGLTEINSEELAAGFAAALAGDENIDVAQSNAIVQQYMQAAAARKGAAAREEGERFLEENGARPEVTTTESGLQYEIIKPGSGIRPTATSNVKVHYHGTLIDGTVFDSSVERGETISFPLNRVIPGWTEGVQLMPLGAKYRFYIPFDLAYGAQGSPPKIPPYSALIFDVELFEIN